MKPATARDIEETFLGLAFKLHPQPQDKGAKRELEYAMVVHDGTGVVEGESFTTHVQIEGLGEKQVLEQVKDVTKEVLARIRDYETDRGVKVSL